MIKYGLLRSDLDQILNENREYLDTLSDKKILILGGTGFIGSWLSKSLVHYMDSGGRCALTIASRNAKLGKPIYSQSRGNLSLVNFDILKNQIQNIGDFDLIINCATPTTAATGNSDAQLLYRTITEGTNNLLNSLSTSSKLIRFVNLSSGAVRVLEQNEIDRDSLICPSSHLATSSGAYSHGKRISEEIVESASRAGIISGINLRLYAFAGPGIPLDQHFAFGNFMRDAFERKKVSIKGNPETIRSYQYPTDLVHSILLAATTDFLGTFEVGGQDKITMKELATKISLLTSQQGFTDGDSDMDKSSYFPQSILMSDSRVGIDEVITRWWKWLELKH